MEKHDFWAGVRLVKKYGIRICSIRKCKEKCAWDAKGIKQNWMFYVAKVRTLLLVFDAFCAGQYILEEKGLRIKNPSSSIYNLVHLKKEWNYPFFRVKVLEGQAGHAKNSLGRHYLRSRALWQSLLGGKDIGKDWLSLLAEDQYTKIIWNGKFALVRPKHLSSRPKTEIRPFSFFNKICYPFSHFFIPLGGKKSSRFFSYFLQIWEWKILRTGSKIPFSIPCVSITALVSSGVKPTYFSQKWKKKIFVIFIFQWWKETLCYCQFLAF